MPALRAAAALAAVGLALGFAAPVGRARPEDRPAAGGEATRSPAPPNVVILFADDQGYADVGVQGAKGYATPNLDRLAADGVRLTDFYVSSAVCSSSRAALLTGCYHTRVDIAGALNPASRNGIHPRETTIAEMLKTRGYATAIFGKWHLGHHPEFLPTRHGFDEYFGLPYSNDMSPKPEHNPTPNRDRYPPLPLFDGETVVEIEPDQSLLTKRYTDRAVDFIERHRDKPFFLYVPYAMPHVPIFASEEFRGTQPAGLYGDVIAEIDHSVGRIVATLDRLGLSDNTLVVYTSDNGPWLSYGNHAGSAGPLREGKGTAFEGGVRVPAFVKLPGVVPAGKVCRQPVMTLDLLPTIATLAGAPSPELPIDGIDVLELLKNPESDAGPRKVVAYWFDGELRAVREGDWKLMFAHRSRSQTGPPGNDGKTANQGQIDVPRALYNLREDVGETRDLSEEHPEIVARLSELAVPLRTALGDKLAGVAGSEVRPSAVVETPQPRPQPGRP